MRSAIAKWAVVLQRCSHASYNAAALSTTRSTAATRAIAPQYCSHAQRRSVVVQCCSHAQRRNKIATRVAASQRCSLQRRNAIATRAVVSQQHDLQRRNNTICNDVVLSCSATFVALSLGRLTHAWQRCLRYEAQGRSATSLQRFLLDFRRTSVGFLSDFRPTSLGFLSDFRPTSVGFLSDCPASLAVEILHTSLLTSLFTSLYCHPTPCCPMPWCPSYYRIVILCPAFYALWSCIVWCCVLQPILLHSDVLPSCD
jgi:hypothetical protein